MRLASFLSAAALVTAVTVAPSCSDDPAGDGPNQTPDAFLEVGIQDPGGNPTDNGNPGTDNGNPGTDNGNPGTDTGGGELPVNTVGKCVGTPGDKPIQSPCEEHCDCASGYCYDEAFNGDFKFCSIDCSNNPGTPCSSLEHPDFPGKQKYGCLVLNSLKDDYNLDTTSICALRCDSLSECQQYSSTYDQCGNFSNGTWTQWDGHTIAGFGVCLVSSAVQP